MFTREEAGQLKREFWTTFGQYMRPVPSAEGTKVNWVNYKTGYRDMYFRMDADKHRAYIGVVFHQKDLDLQQLFFEQMEELRPAFHNLLEEEWTWRLHDVVDAATVSHVYTELPGVSVFNRADWPEIIAFLKPRIIALDEFWSLAEAHFELLKE